MRSKQVLYRCRTPGWGLLYRRGAMSVIGSRVVLSVLNSNTVLAHLSCRYWKRKTKHKLLEALADLRACDFFWGGGGRRLQEHDPLFGQSSGFLMHFWKILTEKFPLFWCWHNRLQNPGSTTVNIYLSVNPRRSPRISQMRWWGSQVQKGWGANFGNLSWKRNTIKMHKSGGGSWNLFHLSFWYQCC